MRPIDAGILVVEQVPTESIEARLLDWISMVSAHFAARFDRPRDTLMHQGKTAAVIGIGPGLGLAIARRFAREGFSVVGLARSPDKLLNEAGIEARQVDAADPAGLEAALHAIEADLGPIEV